MFSSCATGTRVRVPGPWGGGARAASGVWAAGAGCRARRGAHGARRHVLRANPPPLSPRLTPRTTTRPLLPAGTTPLERIATQFLFDAVDRGGVRFAENKARKQLRAAGLLAAGGGGSAAAAAASAAPSSAAAGGGGKAKAKGGKGKKKSAR
jgi:hypothetical protein